MRRVERFTMAIMISSRSRPKSPSSVTVRAVGFRQRDGLRDSGPDAAPQQRSTARAARKFSMTTSAPARRGQERRHVVWRLMTQRLWINSLAIT